MTLRVLIVEDELRIAQAHAEYVSRIEGFAVVGSAATATDGLRAAARAAAAGNPVDLVLADVGLPDRSGLDMARELATMSPRPDVIMVTSARDIETVRAAVARGAMLYLIKPFTFAAFAAKLERYREFRRTLGAGDADQRDVDAALAALRDPAPAPSTPKGMAPSTLALITAAVRDAGQPIGAGEVASRTGISRVTAWRYLERLADDRVVERVTDYGGRGRPEVRYRWL
ncbi:response regulator [Nocardiopsis tropica]|uniref:response regulator n=1 Tax=Tsukamurella strandjordii TaxID=147577 RepID=UPI0031D7DEA2